jgi:aspartate carbamoyltransferase catalytic subunit
MPIQGMSLLDTKDLSEEKILSLFDLTALIKKKGWGLVTAKTPKLVSLVFLEPSTRTASSFEAAALKSGHKVMTLNGDSSSTKKGETVLDTLLTLNAMGPDLFVVRHGTSESLKEIAPQLNTPVINGGEGVSGHPTQGLLDAFTILESRGKIKGEKILVIGDVKHSRVAASGLELLSRLGAETAICTPAQWATQSRTFSKLEEGLKWATVCMALRVQKERQEVGPGQEMEFVSKYQLNSETLKSLAADAIIMHPGPFNRGVEITNDVLTDKRCRIWNQVENGTYLRGALMAQIFGVTS